MLPPLDSAHPRPYRPGPRGADPTHARRRVRTWSGIAAVTALTALLLVVLLSAIQAAAVASVVLVFAAVARRLG